MSNGAYLRVLPNPALVHRESNNEQVLPIFQNLNEKLLKVVLYYLVTVLQFSYQFIVFHLQVSSATAVASLLHQLSVNRDAAQETVREQIPSEIEEDPSHTDCESESSSESGDSSSSVSENLPSVVVDLPKLEKMKAKHNLEDSLLPPLVKTTKFECLLMVLNFAMQEGLSYKGIHNLLKLINGVFGQAVIPESIAIFRSLFQCDIGLSYHFYCPNDFYYFGDYENVKVKGLKCPIKNCKWTGKLGSMNSGNFFIYMPLAPQLRVFLESRPNARELLKYRFCREIPEDAICDVFDGKLHKRLSCEGCILNDPNNFSITAKTDGSPIFESVPNTAWPIQARINELPPEERFNSNNMFVCGIWFGAHEPNMNVFLAPFVLEARSLYETGFQWQSSCGTKIQSRVATLNFCLDSKAKPDVQCFKQLHSYDGCWYCYHPGILVNLTKNQRVLVDEELQESETDEDSTMDDDSYDEEIVDAPQKRKKKKRDTKAVRYCCTSDISIRKDKDIRADMETSLRENSVVRGVRGKSVLTLLHDFDMVNGFIIDYMHATLLGIVKMLLNFWLHSKYSKKPFSIRSRLSELNSRLLQLTPTSNISRLPRKLSDYIHYHANELRAWLFFYSIPSLCNILPTIYFQHYTLLVSAIVIACSECIYVRDLELADQYLRLFVRDFELLYGPAAMVYNVHLHDGHLIENVFASGPLWSSSAFSFETGNGVMVNLVKGTVGVMKQIANKYMTYRCLPKITDNFIVSDDVMTFCEGLIPRRMSKHASKYCNVTVLGPEGIEPLSIEHSTLLAKANLAPGLSCFHRMIVKGVKYHSVTYPKSGTRTCDTIAKTSDGKFCKILRIFVVSKQAYVLVRIINIAVNETIVRHQLGPMCKHLHVCTPYPFSNNLEVLKANAISSKCVFLKQASNILIAEFPNMFEKD